MMYSYAGLQAKKDLISNSTQNYWIASYLINVYGKLK